MAQINLSDEGGRDAMVNMQHIHSPRRVRWLDDSGRQVTHVRVLKSTIDRDMESLVEEHGDVDNVTQMLLDGDPEVDLERAGAVPVAGGRGSQQQRRR